MKSLIGEFMARKKVNDKVIDGSLDELYKRIESLENEVRVLNSNFLFCKKHAEKAGTDANEYRKIIIKMEQEHHKIYSKIDELNIKLKSR